MKGATLMLFVAIAILASAMLQYRHNSTHTDDLDKFMAGMRGIDKSLVAGVPILLREPAAQNYFLAYARYSLAPVYVSYGKEGYDTVLDICSRRVSDSLRDNALKAGRRILWENSDESYYYYLTSSK